MNQFVPLSDFMSRDNGIESHEAVALVLELIDDFRMRNDAGRVESADSSGVDSVVLGPDGTVRCDRRGAAPAS